jgi:hypothetical protein
LADRPRIVLAEVAATIAAHWRFAMIPELAPGNRFPDLDLPDHSGHERQLSELAGGDPLVLNCYRGWW